ncbi:MAG: hypothetical protein H6832_12575 [Planctomycetes bacterium]|nr:hypothetical protein [Planctomycetota bacterium]MCB9891666.1 hypothetical protein [Planctomycetota bacterium]MCB9919228.1 hypothetical protein [Planctomycetota bacterium]
MKDTLAGIVQMLETGEAEQQVAAAQVLAWLGPKSPPVVKALGRAASSGDGFLRGYAVEALASIGNAAALSHLIPILHVEGPLRSKVARALSALGDDAEKVLVKEFEKSDRDTRIVIIEILARTRGAEGLKTILCLLKDDEDPDIAEIASQHFIHQLETLQAPAEEDEDEHEPERARIRKVLLTNLQRIPKKAPTSYRVYLLRFLRRVADPSCRTVFVTASGPSNAPEVRAAGLRGLRDRELTTAQRTKILGYLDDEDFVHVVGPALEVLQELEPTGAPMANSLLKLLDNARPEVRLFALAKLAHYNTAACAKALLPFLDNDDPQVHDLASKALGQNAEAREGLVKRFLAARDLQEARRPFDALKAIAAQLTAGQCKKLVAQFLKLLGKDDPVRELYRAVLADAPVDQVVPPLLDEARAARNKQDYDVAFRILQALSGSGSLSHEVRYEIALATLLGRAKSVDLSQGDPVIGHLCILVREGFPLVARLKREKNLETDHALYLGQRFVERLNEERKFGFELLNWLIEKRPEAKEAIQAMQKLKVEGLA